MLRALKRWRGNLATKLYHWLRRSGWVRETGYMWTAADDRAVEMIVRAITPPRTRPEFAVKSSWFNPPEESSADSE